MEYSTLFQNSAMHILLSLSVCSLICIAVVVGDDNLKHSGGDGDDNLKHGDEDGDANLKHVDDDIHTRLVEEDVCKYKKGEWSECDAVVMVCITHFFIKS